MGAAPEYLLVIPKTAAGSMPAFLICIPDFVALVNLSVPHLSCPICSFFPMVLAALFLHAMH
jgi:hypothetical protein